MYVLIDLLLAWLLLMSGIQSAECLYDTMFAKGFIRNKDAFFWLFISVMNFTGSVAFFAIAYFES